MILAVLKAVSSVVVLMTELLPVGVKTPPAWEELLLVPVEMVTLYGSSNKVPVAPPSDRRSTVPAKFKTPWLDTSALPPLPPLPVALIWPSNFVY